MINTAMADPDPPPLPQPQQPSPENDESNSSSSCVSPPGPGGPETAQGGEPQAPSSDSTPEQEEGDEFDRIIARIKRDIISRDSKRRELATEGSASSVTSARSRSRLFAGQQLGSAKGRAAPSSGYAAARPQALLKEPFKDKARSESGSGSESSHSMDPAFCITGIRNAPSSSGARAAAGSVDASSSASSVGVGVGLGLSGGRRPGFRPRFRSTGGSVSSGRSVKLCSNLRLNHRSFWECKTPFVFTGARGRGRIEEEEEEENDVDSDVTEDGDDDIKKTGEGKASEGEEMGTALTLLAPEK